jgi:uncharacterized membrane protein
VDGIVLHQLLQWHHMLTSAGNYPSTTVAGLETNTLWDGIFHAATWIAVAAGLYILWRRTTDWHWAISGRAFIGWMLVAWGLFNLVEGVVDHHILTIHHVREGVPHEWAYDIGFSRLWRHPRDRRLGARPIEGSKPGAEPLAASVRRGVEPLPFAVAT